MFIEVGGSLRHQQLKAHSSILRKPRPHTLLPNTVINCDKTTRLWCYYQLSAIKRKYRNKTNCIISPCNHTIIFYDCSPLQLRKFISNKTKKA